MCGNLYSSNTNSTIISTIRLYQEHNLTVYVLTAVLTIQINNYTFELSDFSILLHISLYKSTHLKICFITIMHSSHKKYNILVSIYCCIIEITR